MTLPPCQPQGLRAIAVEPVVGKVEHEPVLVVVEVRMDAAARSSVAEPVVGSARPGLRATFFFAAAWVVVASAAVCCSAWLAWGGGSSGLAWRSALASDSAVEATVRVVAGCWGRLPWPVVGVEMSVASIRARTSRASNKTGIPTPPTWPPRRPA